jgi:DnaJ-class molecular chaperone
MTHYATLGIAENATPEEIKKAYRKLASQHHPDKGGDTARFQEIQAAYDTLADADRRQRYDHERSNPGGMRFNFNGQDMTGHPDVENIFRNFGFHFGGSDPFAQFRQQHQPQPRRNRDLQIEIQIPLAETLTEQTKTISVQTTNGHRETVEVRIPRGLVGQPTIKYPLLGDNFFASLPRGDLYVNVVTQPHPNFEVHGLDLVTTMNVDCLMAMAGGDMEVSGLDGRIFQLSIPAGAQPNMGFRITGQGLWHADGLTRGHLIVKISITVPQLTADQIALVNQIRQSL